MAETKRCPHCDLELSRSQFYVDRKRADGLTAYCKVYYADYYAANRERQRSTSRAAQIKKRYGLTVDQYEAIVANGCEVCGEQTKRIVVDHCHERDVVRGPLCDGCNVALGGAKDSPDTLRALADYVERHAAT